MSRLFAATTPTQVTRQVIFEGACIDRTDEQGDTALHSALRRHVVLEVIAELVRLGARIDAPGRQFHTPLLLAIYHPDVRVMQFLLDKGASVDGLPMQLTPLQAAVFNDSLARVEMLLTHGADVHHPGFLGKTPLFAARSGAMVRHLLQAGADPFFFDDHGQSPVDCWLRDGPVEALEAVLKAISRPRLKVVGDSS